MERPNESAVRQAHCELSAVRQDFSVTLRQAQGGDAQSNAHCELSAE